MRAIETIRDRDRVLVVEDVQDIPLNLPLREPALARELVTGREIVGKVIGQANRIIWTNIGLSALRGPSREGAPPITAFAKTRSGPPAPSVAR